MPPEPGERRWLLDFARAAILAHVVGIDGVADAERAFAEVSRGSDRDHGADGPHSGVFVSLHRQGELRGCIGTLDGTMALAKAVGEAAVAACSADPRFPPLSSEELSDLEIQISILGAAERVTDVETIELGRHGLIVAKGHRRGLLLPQVAIERGWTRQQFLDHTCEKAGLRRDAWKSGAIISRFEAEVVGR